MKFILTILCLIQFTFCFGMDISVSYATFKGDQSDYVEVYLYAVGSSLDQKVHVDSMLQANIEVTILFKQGEEIIQFDKYLLNGPMVKSPTDFIDLKRYGLNPGKYKMEVTVVDQNDLENQATFNSNEFKIDYSNGEVAMSDIQLLVSCKPSSEKSPFVKNGFFLEPAPFNFFNKQLNTLFFYTEIYNSEKLEDNFVITYTVKADSKLEGDKEIVIGHKTKSPAEMSLLVMPLDISKLPSGNYILNVQTKYGDKILSTKAVNFQRLNPYVEPSYAQSENFDMASTFVGDMSMDDLVYSLRAIMPKMYGPDTKLLNSILSNRDSIAMQTKLFTYWANKNPNKPQEAYDKYMEVARAVDNQFNSGLGHGFESDRGFIFLRYGKPTNLIAVNDEPDAAPYEIWFYDQFPFTAQTDVKFLFYNPSYAAGQYELLHSNARGEINNPQWQIQLYKNIDPDDIVGDDYLNATEVSDGINRNASRYFNDF